MEDETLRKDINDFDTPDDVDEEERKPEDESVLLRHNPMSSSEDIRTLVAKLNKTVLYTSIQGNAHSLIKKHLESLPSLDAETISKVKPLKYIVKEKLPMAQMNEQIPFTNLSNLPIVTEYQKRGKDFYGPPSYSQVLTDTLQERNQLLTSLGTSLVFRNELSQRLSTIETSVSESQNVANQTHQIQQTMSDQMNRIEQRLQERHENFLMEERISQQVVERLVQNPQFKSMVQTREVSMSHIESLVNRMEKNPPLERRNTCCCKRSCFCHCHIEDIAPKTEGNFKKKKDGPFKLTEKRNCVEKQDLSIETWQPKRRPFKGHQKQMVKENSSEDGVSMMLKGATGGDPGDSPSDDNSSDDDSGDFHKDNKYKKKQKDADRGKHKWVIDAAAWTLCLENDDDIEAQAASLLDQKKLPNQELLNKAFANEMFAQKTLEDICHHISNYIKDKSQFVLSIWAAYTFTKDTETCGNEIIFVLLFEGTDKVVVNDFTIHQRCISDVRSQEENLAISEKELNNMPSPEERQGLEKCLKENAKSLMNNHSKVTRVTASWFRAGLNEAGHRSLRKEHCIVLYVHIKGYVPLNEEPFPTKIGEYPVDIREGVFILCNGPNEPHKNVKMGCCIRGENQGTLGAFIEIDGDSHLYGLTCAHVVFGNEKLKQILERKTMQFGDVDGVNVYQPASEHEGAPFGNTVFTLYTEGGNGFVGMEIALIQINQDRLPTDGSFPDDDDLNYTTAGFGPDKPFAFRSGKYVESLNCLHSPLVFKYGAESKLTQGVCRLNGASVRTRVFKDKIIDHELTLHDQIEIMSLDGNPFAERGDSGALILTNDINSNELSALGIFEGQMQGENVFNATPMYAILNELRQYTTNKQCALKRFHPYNMHPMANRADGDMNEKFNSLTSTVTYVRDKVERIEQDFAAHKNEMKEEQRRQTQEIKEQQRKQSEEQKRQTQELKEHQRQQSEEHKKQTQELKDQQKEQSEENKKQTQELKDQQKQQTEELKEQRKQGQEIKDQTTQILNLLSARMNKS